MAMSRVLWVIGLSMTALLAGCLVPRQGSGPTVQELKRHPPTLSAPIFVSREWCDMDGDGTVSKTDATFVRENPDAVRDKLDRLVSLVNELAEVPYEPDWENPGRAYGWRPCPAVAGGAIVRTVLLGTGAKGVLMHCCSFAPGCNVGCSPVTSEEWYQDCVGGAVVFQRQAVSGWQWRTDHPQGVKLVAARCLE